MTSQKPWFSWALLSLCVLAVLIGLAMPAFKSTTEGNEVAHGDPEGKTAERLANTLHKISGGYLAHIKLQGPISMELDDNPFSQHKSNAVEVRDALTEATEDDTVKGILLTVNSPGGTVAMSQELHAAVVRARAKKPVLVYMGDVAASGGYYTACAADEIVANPGTLTASIGVIMSGLSFEELTHKLGVKSNTVKSGKFKDLMSPYRTATADETALLQAMIQNSYQQFLGAVLDGRLRLVSDPAKKAARETAIRAVADGRVVTGQQGLAAGLVDTLGDVDVAYEHLNTLAKKRFKMGGDGRLPLESYNGGHPLMDLLSFGMSGQANVLNSLMPRSASALVESSLGGVVPFSARHPKQPLWMME